MNGANMSHASHLDRFAGRRVSATTRVERSADGDLVVSWRRRPILIADPTGWSFLAWHRCRAVRQRQSAYGPRIGDEHPRIIERDGITFYRRPRRAGEAPADVERSGWWTVGRAWRTTRDGVPVSGAVKVPAPEL